MPKAIPERQPVSDRFQGAVVRALQADALALGPLPGAGTVAEGDFVVRYAIRFLGKSHLSIVPGLVVLDYGDMLTGEDAWSFLLKRSNLYPRSEVVGYRDDGTEDMVFIRQLDLAQPVQVLVYPDGDSHKPLARPAALIARDTGAVAPRLLEFLPVYPSIENWQAERQP